MMAVSVGLQAAYGAGSSSHLVYRACVCVCVSVSERASIWKCRCLYVPMVRLFWILSALSKTTHKPP